MWALVASNTGVGVLELLGFHWYAIANLGIAYWIYSRELKNLSDGPDL